MLLINPWRPKPSSSLLRQAQQHCLVLSLMFCFARPIANGAGMLLAAPHATMSYCHHLQGVSCNKVWALHTEASGTCHAPAQKGWAPLASSPECTHAPYKYQ
jgi:hypothetical protein